MCHEEHRKKKKCSPVVELHYASLNRAGGGGVKIFQRRFRTTFIGKELTIKLMIVTMKLMKVDGS